MKELKELKVFFKTELEQFVSFIKVGTESEAMLLSQIVLLMNVTQKEMVCKIGGPDARSDIFSMGSIGAMRFVAPMIESSFSIKKFTQAITKTIGITSVEELCINIESVTALSNIDCILEEAMTYIHRINVGFSDLAASMNTHVTDTQLMKMTKNLRDKCKILDKHFSFGGSVTPENIEMRLVFLKPDLFETRLLGFSADVAEPAVMVRKGLEFEMAFESLCADFHELFMSTNRNRASSIKKRLTAIQLAA